MKVQRCVITPLTVDLKKTKCCSNLIFLTTASVTDSKILAIWFATTSPAVLPNSI